MKIAGFTIVKNAVEYDYPVVESIRSILPVVDEMIVSIGDCTDGTEALIRSIGSPKIKIVHSFWDPALKEGGRVLAAETNKAFAQVPTDADWAFYIQADEVIHEQYHEAILAAARQYKDDKRVDGLLFTYKHFYGSYDYTGDSRKWYGHEIRMVRNDPQNIQSFRDAQGFRKNGGKLRVKKINAQVYHYGWVRHPNAQLKKLANFYTYWDGAEAHKRTVEENDLFDYLNNADSLARFTGTHPQVMHERIAQKNWALPVNPAKKKFSFKDRLLYRIEKLTGKRLFDYKNYRII
jgi:hypothetical protein